MTSTVIIDYVNHRGERRERPIQPQGIIWSGVGTNWHPGPLWILWAVDLEDVNGPLKGFAMKDIHGWREVAEVQPPGTRGEGG